MRRLHAIADIIGSQAAVVADIGYDHGHLLAILAQRRPTLGLIGVELQPTAAALFTTLHPELAPRVALKSGSGFEPLSPADGVTTAVIAGMGEHRVTRLLTDGPPEVLAGIRRLVCCPADFRHLLRPFLHARGWGPVADTLVVERGRHYEVMAYERSTSPPLAGTLASCFGTLAEPDLGSYCHHLCTRHQGALAAPTSASSPVLTKLRAAARYSGQDPT